MKRTALSPDLQAAWENIDHYAQDYGLDYFPIIFEVLDYQTLYEIAALGGFPVRYPHWRFGMAYDQLSKGYAYGLSVIYEMVINTNPSYAYLLEGNELVTQKMVMAHVTAHVDFFKNNMWFAHTNRKMLDEMANHATRVQRLIDRYGYDEVEQFIDVCLSLENLVDYHAPYIVRPVSETITSVSEEHNQERSTVDGFPVQRGYMQDYINPPEYLAEQRNKLAAKEKENVRFPEKSQKDILLFLLNYAPLRPWQRAILEIVRDEAYYYAPQGMTKILNEGWASFWHSVIMTQNSLTDAEIIRFADQHSGVVTTNPGHLNPYKLGLELLRDIEDRWNKGKFGKDYDNCDDIQAKQRWDQKLGLGRQKIFEVRQLYNDITFIDEFLTPEFVVEQKLFNFEHNPDTNYYEIVSRDFVEVKEKLLMQLTNLGQPYITVEDGNYKNRGELYLLHRHEGVDLQMNYAQDTLRNLHLIWTRPVHIETIIEDQKSLLSFDGQHFTDGH